MKAAKFLLVLGLAVVAGWGCNQGKQARPGTEKRPSVLSEVQHHPVLLPDTLGVSRDTLQANIEAERSLRERAARESLVAEAQHVLAEVRYAVWALERNKPAAARDSLKAAQSAIKQLLGHYTPATLLPVDASVEVFHLASSMDTVKAARDLAIKLVKRGELQPARKILDHLVSEIRITTLYLPLGTFQSAVDQALALLERNDAIAARQVLLQALTALSVREQAIPLPLVVARSLVATAASVADSARDAALLMLKNARKQLELARLLGYRIHDPEYKVLDRQIAALQKRLGEGSPVEQLFAKLADELEGFVKKFSGQHGGK